MLCYIARRHGEVELQELARFLQVKELSTASHAVRRAEARLKNNSGFSRRVDQFLRGGSNRGLLSLTLDPRRHFSLTSSMGSEVADSRNRKASPRWVDHPMPACREAQRPLARRVGSQPRMRKPQNCRCVFLDQGF